jgi:hypothetical protein
MTTQTPDIRGLRPGQHRLPCPECAKGKRDDALSVLVRDDGSAVWKCFRCSLSGATRGERQYRVVNAPAKPRSEERRVDNAPGAAIIWRQTVPLADTLGEEYLRGRYCALPPAEGDVRFHPALFCPETESKLPALVARVSTVIGNRTVGIHRIWFRPGETKAVKKMRLGGSDAPVCVRLWPDDNVEATLGIAEGIESALAAARAFKPMWSCIDAGGMTRFPLPPGLESLTIFRDNDIAGEKAGRAVWSRYMAAGINANLWKPTRPGEDINDVVRMAYA